MSQYTDAASQPGKKPGGSDERELFLTNFGEMVLEAWEEVNDYDDLTFHRFISKGKADTFPVIGRKRDATEHTPGELIVGGSIEHNEVEISLDKMLVDSAFIAEIDELMAHYNLARPYARQLAESLNTTYDRRLATLHIKASRVTEEPYTGGPVPSFYGDADVDTDPSKLEDAAFAAVAYIKERDIGGGPLQFRLPWQQYLLLARYSGVQGGAPAAGTALFHMSGRETGKTSPLAGLMVKGTNHIPHTNITGAAGVPSTKYQGDFTDTIGHISNMMAVGTLNRRGLKVVMVDQKDRLGTLLIASKFCGSGILRPETSFEVFASGDPRPANP
jgi:hypothetical protein